MKRSLWRLMWAIVLVALAHASVYAQAEQPRPSQELPSIKTAVSCRARP